MNNFRSALTLRKGDIMRASWATLAGLVLVAVAVASYAAGVDQGEKRANGRVFELRTYTAAPGKMEALNARFRDHTCKLFEKHGMTNIGYWTPVENPERKLYYILAYPDRAAREESWKEFMADPVWKAAFAESETGGKLVDKVESAYLQATDFSP